MTPESLHNTSVNIPNCSSAAFSLPILLADILPSDGIVDIRVSHWECWHVYICMLTVLKLALNQESTPHTYMHQLKIYLLLPVISMLICHAVRWFTFFFWQCENTLHYCSLLFFNMTELKRNSTKTMLLTDDSNHELSRGSLKMIVWVFWFGVEWSTYPSSVYYLQ